MWFYLRPGRDSGYEKRYRNVGKFKKVIKNVMYRVSHPVMQRGFLEKFYGVPPACWPLLQLVTAQAEQGNSPRLFQKTSLHDGMGNAVVA